MANSWNKLRRWVFTASRLRESSSAICWFRPHQAIADRTPRDAYLNGG
jgi:hypothetical protein